jgi:hypothetical protein
MGLRVHVDNSVRTPAMQKGDFWVNGERRRSERDTTRRVDVYHAFDHPRQQVVLYPACAAC